MTQNDDPENLDQGAHPEKQGSLVPVAQEDDEEQIKDQMGDIIAHHLPNGQVTREAKNALRAELTEHVMTLTRSVHSGPLPAPETLEHYERILPGAANRVFTMAENEQGIRRQENSKVLHNDRIKIIGSVGVSMAMIAAGVYCGTIDQPALGIAIGTSGAVLGIFKSLGFGRGKGNDDE